MAAVSGADVLEAVVKYGWTDGLADRERGVSITYVASVVTGVRDGRKIMGRLRKLEAAGLVEIRRISDTTFAKATERGREVDAILVRITAARGGSFVPRREAGITGHENLAL